SPRPANRYSPPASPSNRPLGSTGGEVPPQRVVERLPTVRQRTRLPRHVGCVSRSRQPTPLRLPLDSRLRSRRDLPKVPRRARRGPPLTKQGLLSRRLAPGKS